MEIPTRVAAGPEEFCTHVVIHAMHVPIEPAEVIHHLRTDQSRRSRDEQSGSHEDQLWIRDKAGRGAPQSGARKTRIPSAARSSSRNVPSGTRRSSPRFASVIT